MSRLESENMELRQKERKINLKSKIYEEHFDRKERKSQKIKDKFDNLTSENDHLKQMIEFFNSKPSNQENNKLSNQKTDSSYREKNTLSVCLLKNKNNKI